MSDLSYKINTNLYCYHCGQHCDVTPLWIEDKSFCCSGCKTVYEILQAHDMCTYYSLDQKPGVRRSDIDDDVYAYLNVKDIGRKLLQFDSDTFSRVQFYIPAIHCVSCIWLLENLQRLGTGILKSEVNFARKSVRIDFNPQLIKLSDIATLLASVGYAPNINLEGDQHKKPTNTNKSIIVKLAVAGFCFGNVMLFSFPEYLGLDKSDIDLMRLFSWLNVLLSLPVFFYSSTDYFTSAWRSFKQKQINIDVPIAVGLLALFLRSVWDIITHFGPGYLDSFTGLVFFLLVGRWFQNKTYESLAFDRDFKSYFPLAVHRRKDNAWEPVVVYELQPGDNIRIRNMEIIPADSVLSDDRAYIDYSFVTGESKPVSAKKGDSVFAGGRLIGQPVELLVQKKTSQSHLTSLWNHDTFHKPIAGKYRKLIDRAARRFTWVVLFISLVTAISWYFVDASRMWLVLTSVLMVACPCALALAAPFTYGNMLRVFGRHGFYLKNADVIEHMAGINAIVFDKTGTITNGSSSTISFIGSMEPKAFGWVKLLTGFSTHPLSTLIAKGITAPCEGMVVDFKELPGKGIEAIVDGHKLKIGSAVFTGFYDTEETPLSKVYVSIDGMVKGYFLIETAIRPSVANLVQQLGARCVALLSGDNDSERKKMSSLFSSHTELCFNQSPHDKLDYISKLQREGKKVLMLGDGLNDSGALKQSNVGIAITDDTGVFTPACDGILQGNKLGSFHHFLQLSRSATVILKIAFGISFLYNIIALSFAVSGHLTPLIAAVLMPISSISVVGFSSLCVNFVASTKKL